MLNDTTNSTLPHLGVMFSWYDYIIFVVMLGLSVVIGIYFGCFGTKQSTASEYLMGGKKMHIIPIAISLVASHVSGITLLGVPADVYRFGAAYWLCIITLGVMAIITVYVYLPVYYNLQITSTYEYLQRRFDNKTRIFSSFLFALSQLLFLPIVVYIPALAFAAATGINLHLITPIICGICIFYTTIGGLKAVVWTDTLQFTITIGAVTTVLVLGTNSAGGFGEVWRKSIEGHRLDLFDFNPDITQRDGFWAVAIGFTCLWISSSNTNQSAVQKFLSVSTLREAKLSVLYYCIGLILVKSASVITGLIIYAKYADCDPFETKQITRNDQLLPYYVLDVAGHIPCLPGLFIAGVFSAALSTLSAHLNCVAGTIFEDFVSKCYNRELTEKEKSNILKVIVVIFGSACTGLVFVVERLGGILPLAIAFNSVTSGPLLGMFTLGVLSRRANCKGALYGGIIGLTFMMWVIMTTQYYKAIGLVKYDQKPVSTAGCAEMFNITMNFTPKNITQPIQTEQVFFLFRISHYYYVLLGFLTTFFPGLIISYLTKPDEKIVEENLLCPMIQNKSLMEIQEKNRKTDYNSIDTALKLVISYPEKEDLKSSG